MKNKKILLSFFTLFITTNILAIDIKIKIEENTKYNEVIKNLNAEAMKVDSQKTIPMNNTDIKIDNKYNNSNINVESGKVEIKNKNSNIKVK